jgi:hypothetical protein
MEFRVRLVNDCLFWFQTTAVKFNVPAQILMFLEIFSLLLSHEQDVWYNYTVNYI